MSFTSHKYDEDAVLTNEQANERIFEYLTNPPRLQFCAPENIGVYATNTSPVTGSNIDLESQIRGLGSKQKRDGVYNWSNNDNSSTTLPPCNVNFNTPVMRERLPLVTNIQLQRFEPYNNNSVELAKVRRPTIGLDSRQFVKDTWRNLKLT